MKTIPSNWSDRYQKQIERNIGIVSIDDQEKLKNSWIGVLGLGGLGGPLALNLVHIGCEKLVLLDFDRIEQSNLNRQPYTQADIDKFKVDALTENLVKINPDVQIRKYYELTEQNVHEILQDVVIIALTLDGPIGSIILAREAVKQRIPMVEGWAMPTLFARWFTDQSMSYEDCYGFPTQHLSIAEIRNSPEILQEIRRCLVTLFLKFPHIKHDFSAEEGMYDQVFAGQIPFRSFAPFVWMEASYLALEVVMAGILDHKEKILAPAVEGYDVLRNTSVSFR
ncbi:MAG: HesA/MoeB/ThiF family protein [Promethearchaeota archaeon]